MIISICHKVRPMGRSLVRQNISWCHNLKVFVFSCHILMLNHHFTNRSLLCKVQLVDTLLEKLIVDVVEADDDLSADRLYCWLLVWRR